MESLVFVLEELCVPWAGQTEELTERTWEIKQGLMSVLDSAGKGLILLIRLQGPGRAESPGRRRKCWNWS